MTRDFLVELGTEELPPTSLKKLSDVFCEQIQQQLSSTLKLNFSAVERFATPRRLAVLVKNLDEQTPIQELTVWGPPVHIAFDAEGKPSKAALAFAKKNGITTEALSTENDGKVSKLIHRTTTGGQPVSQLLPKVVEKALSVLPIPKRMRWHAHRYEFIRPVHWLVMLYGDAVIEATIMGQQAGRLSSGHRFHCNHAIHIEASSAYAKQLQDQGHVIANFSSRKNIIEEQLLAAAKPYAATVVMDDYLLDEVTALVEWPVVLKGQFDSKFLDVPSEALISSMKTHQKYFPLVDSSNQLMPVFLFVANLDSQDPSQVIQGNERVIRPRLADAAFFFETDKKTTLQSKREQLKTIVFQQQLGTVYEKTERVAALAKHIAQQFQVSESQANIAGQLCKADLVSELVLEFPELQGIAGYYYARQDQTQDIALAIKEHYLPRFSGDALPETTLGACVSLADRIDTLIGIFGIDQQPTGSKDPFALRRASLGLLRILVEQQRDLNLRELLIIAYHQYAELPCSESVVDTVMEYIFERFRAWYEEQSIPTEVFQAVKARGPNSPLEFDQRVQATHHFLQLPQSSLLAQANKRVANILAKSHCQSGLEFSHALFQESAENHLAQAITDSKTMIQPLIEKNKYTQALNHLAQLSDVVETFFDHVMVMVDDETLRNNRLALLQQLRNLFFEVADISFLANITSNDTQ